MTALSSEDQRQRGQQLGADRYLVKSQVGIEDVVRTVHEVLGDAPVAPTANAFAPSAPSAVPRPAPAGVPARPEMPPAAPAPMAAPVAPGPQPSPMAAPTPAAAPVTPTAPAAPVTPPAPVAAPAPSPMPPTAAPSTSLPQPTAPFSTPRPAGLADRIIQPIEKPVDAGQPIGDLMAKELGGEPSAPPAAPNPGVPPMPSSPEPSGIAFEETPRQDSSNQ